jgi:hypothetical protein
VLIDDLPLYTLPGFSASEFSLLNHYQRKTVRLGLSDSAVKIILIGGRFLFGLLNLHFLVTANRIIVTGFGAKDNSPAFRTFVSFS